ncbi:MAG: hypothetical protein M3421_01330 [Bacteroidota bacterium]|nr:hypothetical protein [Bacteroidota bacterium]
MKHPLRLILLIFFIIILISSCKDKNESHAPVLIHGQKLIIHKWKLFKVETVPEIPGVNPMDFLEDCYTDNIYSFLPEGVLVVDEGDSKCNDQNPQTLSGEWKLSQDEKQLDLEYGNFNQEFIVLELSEEQLIVRTTLDFNGLSILGSLTFLPLP